MGVSCWWSACRLWVGLLLSKHEVSDLFHKTSSQWWTSFSLSLRHSPITHLPQSVLGILTLFLPTPSHQSPPLASTRYILTLFFLYPSHQSHPPAYTRHTDSVFLCLPPIIINPLLYPTLGTLTLSSSVSLP